MKLWGLERWAFLICMWGLLSYAVPSLHAKENGRAADVKSPTLPVKSLASPAEAGHFAKPKPALKSAKNESCVKLIQKEYQELKNLGSIQKKKEHFGLWFKQFKQMAKPDPVGDVERAMEWNECVLMLEELQSALEQAHFSCQEVWDKLEFLFPPSEEGKVLSSLQALQPMVFEFCR